MKKTTLRFLWIVMLGLLVSGNVAKACNFSDLTFLGVTGTGPYVISVRLCVGMGITGSSLGADQSTRSFMFGFWDSQPGFAISAFTPASVTGPPTTFQSGLCPTATPGCTNNGAIFTNPYLGSTALVRYIQGGAPCSATKSYGCITATCRCGQAQAYCTNHTFTVNQLPDSMIALGIEGAGNGIAGCFPNADMRINFNLLFPLTWGSISTARHAAGVEVVWSTEEESNMDYFIVERAMEGEAYQEIGHVAAVGTTQEAVKYSFLDNAPLKGACTYRIVSVDKSGELSDSKTIAELGHASLGGLAWGAVGPNPASDHLDISFYSPQASQVTYQVFDAGGKRVLAADMDAIVGGNSARIDLAGLVGGSYFLSLQNGKDKLTRKIVKL
jgi:Secretion system C-terminal sorting domain